MTPKPEVDRNDELYQYVDNYDLFGSEAQISKMLEKQKSTEKIKKEIK